MGFLEEVQSEQTATERRRLQNQCQVARWLEEQPEDVQADFAKSLETGSGYDSVVIWRVLKARGADVSVTSVRRHRRGECRCP